VSEAYEMAPEPDPPVAAVAPVKVAVPFVNVSEGTAKFRGSWLIGEITLVAVAVADKNTPLAALFTVIAHAPGATGVNELPLTVQTEGVVEVYVTAPDPEPPVTEGNATGLFPEKTIPDKSIFKGGLCGNPPLFTVAPARGATYAPVPCDLDCIWASTSEKNEPETTAAATTM
jgi:hypothetical protein